MEARQLLATFTVSSKADESDGNFAAGDFSLREAIEQANLTSAVDTIKFRPGLTGLIPLGGTALTIKQDLTIQGPAPNRLGVSGSFSSRVFVVGPGATVNLSGLSVVGGVAAFGAGIYVDQGAHLTLNRVTVEGNAASTLGGGLQSLNASLTVINSAIIRNSAGAHGGGILHKGPAGGGLSLLVINSTISENTADAVGGGVNVVDGAAEFRSCTIAKNRADADGVGDGEDGGGLYIGLSSTASATLHNTIVMANFFHTQGQSNDITGRFAHYESSHNIIGDAATSGDITHGFRHNIVGNSGYGLLVSSEVLEFDLQNNGGSTLTHKLVADSLALDGGSNPLATYPSGAALQGDQRGGNYTRIVDNDNATATIDIGAYEAQPLHFVLSGAVNYKENGAAALVGSGAVFTAFGDRNFAGGLLRVTNAVTAHSDDRLGIRHQGLGFGEIGVNGANVTHSGFVIGTRSGGGATPLVITFTADATPAAIGALVRNITFHSLSENPPTTPRTIRFRVLDADGVESNLATRQVNVTRVNDAPQITPASGGSVGYVRNTASLALLAGGNVLDPDARISPAVS